MLLWCSGSYEDEVFHARTLALPPSEPREASIKSIGALNYFGGVSNAGEQAPLTRLEIEDEGAMFVVVSDVWLDKPAVLDRLRQMFDGYSAMEPPPIFVFMGNFLSQPYGTDTTNVFKGGMDTLCDLICAFPPTFSPLRSALFPCWPNSCPLCSPTPCCPTLM